MKVILLEKIKQLGELGAEVQVKAGYGRNYLIPKNKAVLATPDNIAYFNEKRAELEKVAAKKHAEAVERASKLEGQVIEITAKVSEEGKLYGSISSTEIVEEMAAKGHTIERQEVTLPEGPIRTEGEHSVTLIIDHGEAEAKITVKVIGEQ